MAYAMTRSFLRPAIKSALLGAAVMLVGKIIKRNSHQPHKPGEGAAVREGEGAVRSAGPTGMRTEPKRTWSQEDQASDESFPASDPPGQGVG